MKIYWTCTHCGFENWVSDYSDIFSELISHGKASDIFRCDPEEGGCDKRQVVDFVINWKATSKKIEGD